MRKRADRCARPPVLLAVLIAVVCGLFFLGLTLSLLHDHTGLFDPRTEVHAPGEAFSAAGRTYTLSEARWVVPTDGMIACYYPDETLGGRAPLLLAVRLTVTVQQPDPDWYAPGSAWLEVPAREGDYPILRSEESDGEALARWSGETGADFVSLTSAGHEEGVEGWLLFPLSPDCSDRGEAVITLREYGDTRLERGVCVAEHRVSFSLPDKEDVL